MSNDDLRTDAVGTLVRRHAERREKELRGAYRAGYAYLYVGTPIETRWPPAEFVVPSNSDEPPTEAVDRPSHYQWMRYELDISVAEYRAAVDPEAADE